MKKTHGIIYAILSSAAFGFMPIFAKEAYNHGSNPLTVLTLRFLLASLMLFIYFLFKKISIKINKKQLYMLILIGVFGYTSTGIGLFISYSYISAGVATTMHFIYPSIVVIMSYFIYKEKLTKNKIYSLLLSTLGVFFLVGIKSDNIHPLGAFLALSSGFTYAVCIIEMNREEFRKIHTHVLVFYFSLFSGIALFIFTILSGNLNFKINIYSVSSILGISLVSTIISIILFIKALKIIGPSYTSILSTFEPIVSLIMGILLFKEKLTIPIIIGTIFIILSVILIANTKNSSMPSQKL